MKRLIGLLLLSGSVWAATLAENPEVASGIRLLEAWIETRMAYSQQPGLSIAIVHDQELVWTRGFGYADVSRKIPATPRTAYRMASNTKMFTAIAIMQLRDAGKLSLHDPVAKHLSWFRLKGGGDASHITIWHLLTHTSGLPREAAAPYWTDNVFPTREEVREKLATQEAVYRPETRWKYSNLALALAGEIVEAVSGEPYADYVQRHILTPLGMTSSAIGVTAALGERLATGYGRRMPDGQREVRPLVDCRGIDPAAGLVSTVEDFARFASLQFRAQPAGGSQILAGTTLTEMHQVRWLQPDWKRGWGIGFHVWRSEDRNFVGHGGSLQGYRTQTAFVPAEKIAVVVMTNSDDGQPDIAVEQAFRIVAPAVRKATTKEEREQFNPAWSRYEGLYRSPWGDRQVLNYNDGLVVVEPSASNPLERILKLVPVSDGVFRLESDLGYDDVGELVRFETDAAGNVTRMKVGENYVPRVSR